VTHLLARIHRDPLCWASAATSPDFVPDLSLVPRPKVAAYVDNDRIESRGTRAALRPGKSMSSILPAKAAAHDVVPGARVHDA